MLRPKKKITRKEIQRDPFLESVDQAQAHLEDNRSLYLKIGIGLIAVILFFNFRSDQNAKHGTEASATLGKALVTLDQGDKSSAKFQLETVFNEFEGTSSALMACYYLGKMEYESDNISGAETYLTTFIKKNSKDPLAPSAAIMLSDIFMGSDNVDDALKMVNKALKNSNKYDTRSLEIAKVKIFLAQNKKGEAKEIIDRLLNENDLSTDHKQSVQEMQGMSVS